MTRLKSEYKIRQSSINIVKYNALLIRMQIAGGISVKSFKTYGDSKLIINPVHGEYEV